MPILPQIMQAIGDFIFPIPVNNIQIFWTLMGAQFGGSFGSQLDYEIQELEWFKKQNPVIQGILKRLLDFLHHWWIGAFLWLYASEAASYLGHPFWSVPIMFFGYGLALDDLRDVDNLKKRYKIGDSSET